MAMKAKGLRGLPGVPIKIYLTGDALVIAFQK
jgi:hypothetical protein